MPATPDARRPETIVAFDFGLRRIGVAVGQEVTGSASPLGVIANTGSGVDHEAIGALLADWRPSRLVVGMPMHADGSAGSMTDRVEAFIDELGRHGLPVSTVDERYTSVEAERVLKDARRAGTRRRISKAAVDAGAAVLIAERFLSALSGPE